MMNVNEAAAKLAIGRAEVEAAHAAGCAEVRDARTPSGDVTFVGVDSDTAQSTLPKTLRCGNLVGEHDGRITTLGEEGTPKLL